MCLRRVIQQLVQFPGSRNQSSVRVEQSINSEEIDHNRGRRNAVVIGEILCCVQANNIV